MALSKYLSFHAARQPFFFNLWPGSELVLCINSSLCCDPIVPSVIPTVGMVTRISATEIQVSWDPLFKENSFGSRITYLVRYRVNESRVTRNTEDTSTIVEVEEPNTIISELEPHLAYAVAVAAKNKRGAGEFSDEIIADSEYILYIVVTYLWLQVVTN